MGWNTPDDWSSYSSKCEYCGRRTHASEGGCDCLDEAEKCHGCSNYGRRSYADSRAEAEGYHRRDDLHEISGYYFCESHAACECCALGEGGDEEGIATLSFSEDLGSLVCPTCRVEDHYCSASGPLLDHIADRVSEEG